MLAVVLTHLQNPFGVQATSNCALQSLQLKQSAWVTTAPQVQRTSGDCSGFSSKGLMAMTLFSVAVREPHASPACGPSAPGADCQ